MYRVVIAEDETVVRSTLTALIHQYLPEYQVCGEFQNGTPALEYIQKEPVHLLITDIKMPIMGGIELIENVRKLPVKPIILVISAYNDFQLVRDAFRLGAFDYILKTNIDKDYILKLAENVKPQLEKTFPYVPESGDREVPGQTDLKKILLEHDIVPDDLITRTYYTIAVIEIDTFISQIERFKSGQDMLALKENIIQVISQISRISRNGRIFSISSERYGVLYETDTEDREEISAVFTQVIRVIKTYMNMQVTVGTGDFYKSPDQIHECYEEALELLSLKHILSHGQVFLPQMGETIDRSILKAGEANYRRLMDGLKQANYVVVQTERQEAFAVWKNFEAGRVKQEALSLIYQLSRMLEENDDHIVHALNQDANYYEKINKLHAAVDVEMWVTNFLNWVLDYIEANYRKMNLDDIDKAKRFIADFYSDPTISLSAVADYVGLNEKYLSTKFTKETGITFSSYLTGVRMAKAKELLSGTDMKIYEVSEKSGYMSAEHFMRMFKKIYGMSPNAFRKNNI